MVRTAVVLAAFLFTACSAPDPIPAVDPAVQSLPLSAADYVHIAWPTQATIVLGWNSPDGPGGLSTGSSIALANFDSRQHRVMDRVGSASDCNVVYDGRPQALSDGRFTFLRNCLTDGPTDHHEVLVARTDAADQKVQISLDDIWLLDGRAEVYSVALGTTLRSGFLGIGGVICDTVVRVDGEGPHPFTFQYPNGSDVGNAFDVPCSQTMNVREPNLTADGRELAVLVSPDTLGKESWDRLEKSYDVVLIDLASGTSRVLARDLRSANRMILSPDGSRLVVVSDSGSGHDVRLVPIDGGESKVLGVKLEGPITEVAWSPDSRALVALVRTTPLEELDRRAMVVRLELSDDQ